MVKKVFEVGDSVKSVLVKTHGKDGVVASVDGKKITVQWTRGFPTEETCLNPMQQKSQLVAQQGRVD